jgi:hypothetical protein
VWHAVLGVKATRTMRARSRAALTPCAAACSALCEQYRSERNWNHTMTRNSKSSQTPDVRYVVVLSVIVNARTTSLTAEQHKGQ